MSLLLQKRFWKHVEVAADGEGFAVHLDARPVKTPAKAALNVPSRGLADAIAKEWDGVESEINPDQMPFTRSANSAIDKISAQFDDVATLLSEYGGADLLCYRADSPTNLAERQSAQWDPWLAWAATHLQVNLTAVTGVMHFPQEAADLERLHAGVTTHNAFELVGVHDMITLTGSCVLGLAMSAGALDGNAAWELSRLDEIWQAEFWGQDEDAEAMAAKKHGDLLHAEAYLKLVRGA